ncbi:regulatory protein RecX [Sphingomonas sp. S2-65]|uniref:regulatory protein RecX n=1 Tax=Sphingomonas sp. S2-65 TaxID=2903960 RepID=UPI001F1C4C73|nr:RecX family transcriptional regulator [Sphingomonas sp. S2-65]UYY59576.1 RecX family transcriptional regulator [Sphingomonas sp. S2-65]
MPRIRAKPPPLDHPSLERLALRYVERFATTRARLADYLRRKLRERGWGEDGPPRPDEIADRMAELGYVNDRLFAEAKAGAMARRGLGSRRVGEALRHSGIVGEDAEHVAPIVEADAVPSALAFARRKRIGPFATTQAERPLREKQLGAMLRAGHRLDLSRTIVGMAPGEDVEWMLVSDRD